MEFPGNDPAENLALEEELLNKSAVPLVVTFYVNSPCVVMGKNNREEEWVFTEEARRARIPILRRISGGGAVYHDLGTLNYGFVMSRKLLTALNREREHLMHFFRDIVIRAIEKGGVSLERSGKSDIFLNGRKVGGCSAMMKKERILFHGTLLFTVDIPAMERFLPVPPNRDASVSHRDFVTSFRDEGAEMTLDEAKKLIVEEIRRRLSEAEDSSGQGV